MIDSYSKSVCFIGYDFWVPIWKTHSCAVIECNVNDKVGMLGLQLLTFSCFIQDLPCVCPEPLPLKSLWKFVNCNLHPRCQHWVGTEVLISVGYLTKCGPGLASKPDLSKWLTFCLKEVKNDSWGGMFYKPVGWLFLNLLASSLRAKLLLLSLKFISSQKVCSSDLGAESCRYVSMALQVTESRAGIGLACWGSLALLACWD